MHTEDAQSDDRALLKRAVEEACPKALSELYQKHELFIANYIARQVSVNGEGRDLVHAVFLRLCQGSCQYSGQSDVRGYLCGIAKNVLREHFRSKRRHIQVVSSIEVKRAGDLRFACNSEAPSDALRKGEIRQIIQKAVMTLPEKSRQAVELVYFECIPVPQAATKAGCTAKVFRARLGHGLALLSMALDARQKKDEL